MNGLNKDKKDPYIFRHPRLIPGEYKVDEFLSAALKNSENRKKHFQKRYNDFRFFIWKNDGDIDYFKNIYIQKIIMEIIDGTKNKDNKENLSPLYYRFPNQDGTFDICEWIDEDYVKESNYINKFYDNFLLTTYEINHIDWETKEATIEEKVSIISKKDGHVISAISEYKTLKGKYPYNILNDKEEFERLKQMKEDNSVYLKYGDNPFKLIK